MLARLVLIAGLFVATRLSAVEPPITAAVFAPDGKSVVVGSQDGLRIHAWPELMERATFDTTSSHIHDLVFSPDGNLLAAVGGQPAESGTVELFDWPRAELLHRQTVGEDVLYHAAWEARGEVLAVAGPDHGISLLDRAATVVHRLEGHSQDVVTVAFLPDGSFISGSRDNTIRVWRRTTNALVRTLNNHTSALHDVSVRPGSSEPPYILASSSEDRTVRFWWPVRGRLMRFTKLPSPALDIEWTPDGASLIAVCADGYLRAIDPDTTEITDEIMVDTNWLYTLAIAPSGDRALVGGSSGLLRAVTIR